jgi:flagellar biosynthesis GTPase FlhF
MGANLLTEIYDELKNAAKQHQNKPTFALKFGHAETVVRLANILGLFSTRPIFGNRNRQMLLTRDIPFMANIKLELWQRTPQPQAQTQPQQQWNQPQQQQWNQQPAWNQQPQQQQWNQQQTAWLVRRQLWNQQQQQQQWQQPQQQWQQPQQQQWNQQVNDWNFNPLYNRNQWDPQDAQNALDVNDFQDWDEYTGDYSKRKFPNMYVRMLYNERPMIIPGCQDMYCQLDDVLDLHKEVLKQDVTKICKAK